MGKNRQKIKREKQTKQNLKQKETNFNINFVKTLALRRENNKILIMKTDRSFGRFPSQSGMGSAVNRRTSPDDAMNFLPSLVEEMNWSNMPFTSVIPQALSPSARPRYSC